MKRRLLLSFATLLVSAGLCHTAFADTFTFTLSNANQSGAPGSVLSYVGTLTNSGTTSVNLDGIEFNGTNFVSSTGGACSGTMLCFDEDPFINNAPLSLDAGGSYTGILFNIDIPLSASIGQFAGNVDIAGRCGSAWRNGWDRFFLDKREGCRCGHSRAVHVAFDGDGSCRFVRHGPT